MSPTSSPAPDDPDALFGLTELLGAEDHTEDPEPGDTPEQVSRLLDVREIYAEPAAALSPRGRQVIARFPRARVLEVGSHWNIPHLHGNEGNADRWVSLAGLTVLLIMLSQAHGGVRGEAQLLRFDA